MEDVVRIDSLIPFLIDNLLVYGAMSSTLSIFYVANVAALTTSTSRRQTFFLFLCKDGAGALDILSSLMEVDPHNQDRLR